MWILGLGFRFKAWGLVLGLGGGAERTLQARDRRLLLWPDVRHQRQRQPTHPFPPLSAMD